MALTCDRDYITMTAPALSPQRGIHLLPDAGVGKSGAGCFLSIFICAIKQALSLCELCPINASTVISDAKGLILAFLLIPHVLFW